MMLSIGVIHHAKIQNLLLLFSHSVVSDSLQPHGLHHARLPCPSLSPRVCSNSCALRWWYHPTILSSVVPFSSCFQSFPAPGSFPMCQLFASGGQSIGTLVSALVLPMNVQGWLPLGWTGWISFAVQGALKSLFQQHSSKASVLQHSTFFMVQPSCLNMTQITNYWEASFFSEICVCLYSVYSFNVSYFISVYSDSLFLRTIYKDTFS